MAQALYNRPTTASFEIPWSLDVRHKGTHVCYIECTLHVNAWFPPNGDPMGWELDGITTDAGAYISAPHWSTDRSPLWNVIEGAVNPVERKIEAKIIQKWEDM